MTDVHTPEIRSKNMRAIRSTNTKPELLIRKELFAAGFRFRLHDKNLLGKPDIVLKKYRTVIFVHGCFWHGHDCKYFKLPKTRTEFWSAKITSNQTRDLAVICHLNQQGWHVIQVWECAMKPSGLGLAEIVTKISACLTGQLLHQLPGLTNISD